MKTNLEGRPAAWASIFTLLAAAVGQAQQSSSIVNTKHNLSVSGPGPFRALTESRICIFCHAPHRARTQAPLWNREDSRSSYLTYSSSTFQGTIGQPNGTSKLCLSCHDGTIALGRVVSLSAEIAFDPARRFLSGSASLGTNLADDHPVSFPYSVSGNGYRPKDAIVAPVRLDQNGFVQCTSCHDAHDDTHGDFLRTTDRHSRLCLACHDPQQWTGASHRISTATWSGSGADPWPHAKYSTVAENACANCHEGHGAGQPERLLAFLAEEENCVRCHNGNVATKNVVADLGKPSAHSPYGTQGVHDPTENPLSMSRHSECVDCHDPHAARSGGAAPPGVPGPLTGVSGLDSTGAPVASIRFGYELCYKCHADNHGSTIHVPRVIQQANVRLEFSPANPSFHPIEAAGRNPDVPSLLPPWNTSSRMACTDCHSSDTSPVFGGTGAAGPHGSVFTPLLGANYDTRDGLPESPSRYALCYKCHSRASILNDESFKEHRKHVEKEKVPCSACHDPHGISATQGTQQNNTHLINFDRRLVSPSKKKGELKFVDLGNRRGSCTLLCHGEDHDDKKY